MLDQARRTPVSVNGTRAKDIAPQMIRRANGEWQSATRRAFGNLAVAARGTAEAAGIDLASRPMLPATGDGGTPVAGYGGAPAPSGAGGARAAGGVASAGAAGATATGARKAAVPRLAKSTVSGPSTQPNGEFSWGVRWSIQNATSATNGWIVQFVMVRQDVRDASGSHVTPGEGGFGGLRAAWYPIWEAWQVRGGQVFVGGSTQPHNADTYAQPPVGASTEGGTDVFGLAAFYPNLKLPVSFKVTNSAPAWSLPVANADPGLGGGTGTLTHSLTAFWDGVDGTGATSVTTV